jgi:hypothetical protein
VYPFVSLSPSSCNRTPSLPYPSEAVKKEAACFSRTSGRRGCPTPPGDQLTIPPLSGARLMYLWPLSANPYWELPSRFISCLQWAWPWDGCARMRSGSSTSPVLSLYWRITGSCLSFRSQCMALVPLDFALTFQLCTVRCLVAFSAVLTYSFAFARLSSFDIYFSWLLWCEMR